MIYPVFDLHCDTALALVEDKPETAGGLRNNKLHIDLDRAAILPGYAQCFACFTTPFMEQWYGVSPATVFQRELAVIRREVERNKDRIGIACSPAQIQALGSQGKAAAILTIEGPAGFGFDPARLEELWDMGFRMTTLTWNEKNPLAGSHQTGGGLTDLGREFVKEAQRLGMAIDVSHLSDESFWDIMDITQAPIVASHSNSRRVCDVSRNLTDEMFRAICATGGVAGFNQCAPFVGEKPDLDTVCRHILHWLELDPAGKHIALGGDLDGCSDLPEGFRGIESYPAMAGKLLEQGLTDEQIQDIFWNNAMGVMSNAICDHAEQE